MGHGGAAYGPGLVDERGYLDRVRIKYANAGRPAATKAALVARAIQDGLIHPEDL